MCAVGKRNENMKLPLKVALTENGANTFMQQNKKLQRFKLADNSEEYGISFTEFKPASLQQMILLDYVSKMEIGMPEFGPHRKEIMDVSKIIVFSVLYKQFDREVLDAVLATECIAQWNKNNPSNLVDEKNRPQDAFIRSKLIGKNIVISDAREKILKPVWDNIAHDSSLSTEEKNLYVLMSEKFINHLSLFGWYIIVKFSKILGFEEIVATIRLKLHQYMKKSSLAEYISLMIMELAKKSENENIKQIAHILYRGIDDIDPLLYDPEVRTKLVQELEKRNELIFLSWTLGTRSQSVGKSGKFQITLYNRSDQFQNVKESFDEIKSAGTNKKSLVDFYNTNPDAIGDSSMGLHYLSYIDEACKKVNVKFESIVNQYDSSELTVVNLIFNF